MKQAVMTAPGKIEFNNIDVPDINDNEVLLQIKKIGVCGSDIHVYHGKHPFTSYPIVQGHEYSAVIEKTGKNVTKVIPGQKVTARPQITCGNCAQCRRGDYNICDNLKVSGFQANGCAQDFFVVSEDVVYPVDDSISFEKIALVEPLAVAVYATEKPGSLEGKNVVVYGGGTIGNFIAQAARCRGAARVMLREISAYRLQVADACGIDYISNPLDESMEEAAERVFGPEGFSVAFEAAGARPALTDAVNSISKGGYIGIVGVFSKAPPVNMAFICEHELKMAGSMMYKHEHYLKAIDWLKNNMIQTDALISKCFDFYDYLDAYKYIDEMNDKVMKVMINVNN
ncbi:alcohol dehydrogenase catalytic domain-containing protein [Lentisphaerota bacterium ZTH]|nr:alcohol dehydrogenase catalytic domain-containing protein [Lentisphaerota bacterium]WET07321.1 alcohol dehydrogenase catalytic domain-containing protein [Lentisphaerota bacterium ZTH]